LVVLGLPGHAHRFSFRAVPFEPRRKTLVEICDASVEAHGSRNLFGTKRAGRWVWTTYGEFGALVDRFRAGLVSLGAAPGERVAIVSNNRLEWAVAAFACYGLGAPFVPMYEAQNPQEWDYIVRDCEAKTLIVANDAVLARAKGSVKSLSALRSIIVLEGATNGEGRTTYESLLSASPAAVQAPRPSPGDLAAVLYTSGTTGRPKGVMLTQANMAWNMSASAQVLPVRAADRSLSILPWAHAFGQVAELGTLFTVGASLALSEGVDRILDNLAEVKPSVLACVPTVFNRLYTAVQQQLSAKPKAIRALVSGALDVKAKQRAGRSLSWRDRALVSLVDKLVFEKVRARLGGRLAFAISGGAALSREVAEFIDAIGIVVYEGYGLTETSPVVATSAPGARKPGSVGRTLPGVRVDIDPATSEIIVHGHNVMKGYFNLPDETAAVLTPDGGFHTGDMGYVDAEGYLFITGRIKEQYKLENGKYVVPTPLEERLRLSPFVLNAMVYGDNRPYNVALVVPNVAAMRHWAHSNRIALPEAPDELLKDARVRELFSSEIRAHSSGFKGFERIADFAFVRELTVENGMLTPKMSLKRAKIIEAYRPLIEEMYSQAKGGKEGVARTTA
jgi:long-chain acyl-CoA synthetase